MSTTTVERVKHPLADRELLNLVERLTSDVIRDGSFRSVPELVRAIESYLTATRILNATHGIQKAKQSSPRFEPKRLWPTPFQCQDTSTPDSVIICEKSHGATQLRRLDAVELKPWLEKYRLGELWMRGEIGGTRW